MHCDCTLESPVINICGLILNCRELHRGKLVLENFLDVNLIQSSASFYGAGSS
jgi:hypothetical protein